MELQVLKSLKTYDALDNYLRLTQGMSRKGVTSFDEIMQIEDKTDFEYLRYIASSVAGNYVVKHWFKYKENGLYGIASCLASDLNIKKVTDAKYIDDFVALTDTSEVWLCHTEDGLGELLVSNKVVTSGISSYEEFTLGFLNMFQINYVDEIGLFCYQSDIGITSIYVPKDVNDFREWFERKCKAEAYQGYMEDVSVQDMFKAEFEIENTVFQLATYKYIDIKGNDNE